MDLAYDHIAEETLTKENEGVSKKHPAEPHSSLNSEFQDAYRAFSASPLGARIGGFFGNVVKQVEPVYREATQELTDLGQDATRGFSDLRDSIMKRTRSLSHATMTSVTDAADTMTSKEDRNDRGETTPTRGQKDMSSHEALQESATVLSRLRGEAAKRLRDLQKAEDAADEALLRFGSNLRDFLKDAIQIAPPTSGASGTDEGCGSVLFESKDAQGKRVIHTSRFDAQMHVVHTTTDSFTTDPTGTRYEAWAKDFDIAKKTEDISSDLAKYPELRATMEKLVPDEIPYAQFWSRYYFLRHGIETAEARRRDLLKAASAEEEVGWDEDSDDETERQSTDKAKEDRTVSTDSSTTIHPTRVQAKANLKSSEPRKSHDEKSQPDSESSYDVVGAASGVPSHAPNSPKESRKGEDSDEDWE